MKKNQLKREIGVLGLTLNIVNTIVGSGIFVLPAIIAAGLGSTSILAYLLCGFLITMVMMCFAEVGSKIIEPGGAYAYMRVTFGKYFGFLTAVLFLVSAISADAAVANAIMDIVASLIPIFKSKLVKIFFFLFLFSGLAYTNIIGTKKGIGLVKIITIAKLAPLLLLIIIGFINVDISNLYWKSAPSINKIGAMSLILFFAFQGAETALSVSGEVRNPQKNIPNAIRNAILIVLLFYILIQTVSQGVLGDSLASFNENPLGEVASQILGPIGFTLLTIGAAVSMFGTVSSGNLSMPRVLFGASRDKILPINELSFIHKRYKTPFVAIITYSCLAFLFASFGGFNQLAILSSASILLIYLGVSIAVIKLRKTDKSNNKVNTFRIRGGLIVPIISSVLIIWFLSHLKKDELIVMFLSVVFLSIIYFLRKSIK